jgi:hypothetical protein
VWPVCHEVEVPTHSIRCRKERCGQIDTRPTGQLGRRQSIADRAQVVEFEPIRSEPLEQAGDHVLVNSRFALQPANESAQVRLAAVELSRLSSQLGKLCRLVAKARDLDVLLAGLSTKPGKLPVDRRRILRHKLKVTKRPALACSHILSNLFARSVSRRAHGGTLEQPESQPMTLAPLDLNTRSSATAGLRAGARAVRPLGPKGMDFEAASESLDRGTQVVSVRGEVDLATAPELGRALAALPEDGLESVIVDLTGLDEILAIYPSRAAALSSASYH